MFSKVKAGNLKLLFISTYVYSFKSPTIY